jgi:hypothetical protein
MSQLPESLRRILEARKPQSPAAMPDSLRRVLAAPTIRERTETTTIWRDGEIWREDYNGKRQRLPSMFPIPFS